MASKWSKMAFPVVNQLTKLHSKNHCAFRMINQSTQMLPEYQSTIHNNQGDIRVSGGIRGSKVVFFFNLSYHGVRPDHFQGICHSRFPKLKQNSKVA